MQAILRWFGEHLGTLLLSLILAIAVWVSAVVTADPNEERTMRAIPLDVIGQPSDLVLVNDIPDLARLTLRAPKSIWVELGDHPDLAQAWIDLTGLGAGEHTLEVKNQVDVSPFRFVGVEPQTVQIVLEQLVKREIPVQLELTGDLPLGYLLGESQVEPDSISLSGPKSLVDRVDLARVRINTSGIVETIKRTVPVELLDQDGLPVSGLTISSKDATVTQPIELQGRFKNVAVKVVTTGQVSNGYRLTNISVSPPTFTVFSENPDLINEIPGFVETLPVDIQNLTDDATISVDLNLPEGITSIRDPSVLVQVSLSAIEGSLTLSLPVEVVGLTPDLEATISPGTVDVIIAGPLIVLEQLKSEDFRVVIDLTGLPPGIYQRTALVQESLEQVRIQTTLPETIEVNIVIAPTPSVTPTILPVTPTP